MLKKLLPVIGVTLLVFTFFYVMNRNFISFPEYFEKSIKPNEWKGEIQQKKIKPDKDTPIITFKTGDSLISLDLIFVFNHDRDKAYEIYDAMEVGDSIFKDKNSGWVRFKLKDTLLEYNLNPSPFIRN